jgi:hypothetical protein
MGHLVFSYVQAKVFEIWTAVGFKGICFAEWSKEMLRAVMLGKMSVIWLHTMVEELIRGAKMKDFYRSICSGNTVYVA